MYPQDIHCDTQDERGGDEVGAQGKKKYYHAIDLVRVVAAFIVVAVHTDPLITYFETGNYFINTVIGRLVVPYFFIVSGFFFARKIDFNVPMQTDIHLLKAFLKKIGWIYLIWSAIFLPFQWLDWLRRGDDMEYWVTYIHEFFFKGSYYPLWYLTGLIVATALAYVLFKCLKPWMVLVVTGILFVIGVSMNAYYHVFGLDGWLEGYYDTFLTTRNGVFFGAFYVSIGMILSKREIPLTAKWNRNLFMISLLFMTVEVFGLRSFDFSRGLDMWFFAVPTTYFLFRWLQQVDIKDKEYFAYFRPLSLLIYVSHGLFIIQFKHVQDVNSLLYFFVVLSGTLLLSMSIIFLSKKYPIFRRLY